MALGETFGEIMTCCGFGAGGVDALSCCGWMALMGTEARSKRLHYYHDAHTHVDERWNMTRPVISVTVLVTCHVWLERNRKWWARQWLSKAGTRRRFPAIVSRISFNRVGDGRAGYCKN